MCTVEERERDIDDILAASFPASDPPPWTCGPDEHFETTPAPDLGRGQGRERQDGRRT